MKYCNPLLVTTLVVLLFSFSVSAESVWDEAKESLPTTSVEIKVYRSPDCKYSKGWIEHLEKHDFTVIDVQVDDVHPTKHELGVPESVYSCHTAVIDGYVIEGHVPADDIKRLLKRRPGRIAGLSVPRTLVGIPGMEMGEQKHPFNVISFDTNGDIEAYNEYWAY